MEGLAITQDIKIASSPGKYGLWRLDTPHLLLDHSYLDAKISPITSVKEISGTQPPLLFIHGVEYDSPHEVLRDLIQPFLASIATRNTLQNSNSFQRPIYFISWDSSLGDPKLRDEIKNKSKFLRSLAIASEIPRWHQYFQDVERRAARAGQLLIPFIIEWCARSRMGPTVISHSLGARVWAEALKSIAESSAMLSRPGIWWNLQPALTRRAFAAGGEYAVVAQMYRSGQQSKAVTWYSRLDFILSTMFLIAKGSPALGQFGCPNNSITQIDMTRWVGEAHGTNHISGRLGNLFQRASEKMAEQAADLGIIL